MFQIATHVLTPSILFSLKCTKNTIQIDTVVQMPSKIDQVVNTLLKAEEMRTYSSFMMRHFVPITTWVFRNEKLLHVPFVSETQTQFTDTLTYQLDGAPVVFILKKIAQLIKMRKLFKRSASVHDKIRLYLEIP